MDIALLLFWENSNVGKCAKKSVQKKNKDVTWLSITIARFDIHIY